MDVYKKHFIFKTEDVPLFLLPMEYLWKLIIFYQKENLNKYPKAKNVWGVFLTTVQYN